MLTTSLSSNQNKIKEDQILLKINRIDKNLQFKMTKEENSNIHFLDLAINRGRKTISISIYRKTTNTDTTIHYISNHPFEQKISAYRYYIQRMLTLPISQIGINKEWTIICAMAKSNGFPQSIIHNLRKRLNLKKQTPISIATMSNQKWVPYTFFGPAVRKITTLFKGTNVKIAFRTTNTIQKQLSKNPHNQQNLSRIYSLKCNTCNKKYVGQTGRDTDTRYKEHIRYIRTNNPQSAYATHILQNRHEYGPKNETLKLLKACNKGTQMNCWETMYMQQLYQREILIAEQQVCELNPLYSCICDTRPPLRNRSTVPDTTTSDTHTPTGKH